MDTSAGTSLACSALLDFNLKTNIEKFTRNQLMTIQQRAALVLQQIDAALALAEQATPGPWSVADAGEVGVYCSYRLLTMNGGESIRNQSNAAFIAASRTLLPASLRCLKTAIEGTLRRLTMTDYNPEKSDCIEILTTLCDQWESQP